MLLAYLKGAMNRVRTAQAAVPLPKQASEADQGCADTLAALAARWCAPLPSRLQAGWNSSYNQGTLSPSLLMWISSKDSPPRPNPKQRDLSSYS